jgi:hypothetical protein
MLVLLTAALLSASSAAPTPKVYLLYPPPDGSVFDRNCTQTLKEAPVIDPKWVDEAVRRVPEFQERWDREGPALMAAVLDEIGVPFPYAEMQAAITVCPVASMSLPLMVNVRPYLVSSARRRPDWMWSFTVFHELMHTYTRAANTSSPLRARYSSELPVTLNHLHVLALERFVLTKMGKADELKWLDNDYRTTTQTAYKRAWEIVSDIEGVERVLAELRAPRK